MIEIAYRVKNSLNSLKIFGFEFSNALEFSNYNLRTPTPLLKIPKRTQIDQTVPHIGSNCIRTLWVNVGDRRFCDLSGISGVP